MDLKHYYEYQKDYVSWTQKRLLRLCGIVFALILVFLGVLLFFSLPDFWPWNK